MQKAIDQFRVNISRVKNLGAIYCALDVQTTAVLDMTDVLRAELVLAVSALDQYIHEVVKLGILSIHARARPHTPAFLKFGVTLESALAGMNNPNDASWLKDTIKSNIGHKSFQKSDKIAEAIRLISDVKLWEEVGKQLNIQSSTAKDNIDIIVDRRNKIAHESDIDPTNPGQLWPINSGLVDDSIMYIEQLVEAIHVCIT